MVCYVEFDPSSRIWTFTFHGRILAGLWGFRSVMRVGVAEIISGNL